VDMMRKMMVPAAVAWLAGRPDYSSSTSNLISNSSWTRSTTKAKNLEEEGRGRRAAKRGLVTLGSATEGSSSTRSATTTMTTTTCSITPSEPPARSRRQGCRTSRPHVRSTSLGHVSLQALQLRGYLLAVTMMIVAPVLV